MVRVMGLPRWGLFRDVLVVSSHGGPFIRELSCSRILLGNSGYLGSLMSQRLLPNHFNLPGLWEVDEF